MMSQIDTRFMPLDFARLSAEESARRSLDFLNLMRKRRSVRTFSSEPVPIEIIRNAIATAGSAPSGANQQPWRFIVVADPEVKQQIRAAAEAEERENHTRQTSAEWIEALLPLDPDWHKPYLTDAPYVIVAFQLEYGVRELPSGAQQRVPHHHTAESMGIAVGMLISALHVAGLATLVLTPDSTTYLNQILKRPPNERPFVVMPVGYPAPDTSVPVISRKPLDDIMSIV